jgi:hypothetical protein
MQASFEISWSRRNHAAKGPQLTFLGLNGLLMR